MDVDLDDLYAAGEQQAARRGAVLQAEVAEQAAVSALTHEELLEQLRSHLQELRDKFAAAKKCPDYVEVASKAKALCLTASRGARRHALQQQTANILEAAAAAASSGQDPLAAKVAAAGAAAAEQRLTSDALAALLPGTDDGTTCLLLHVSPQHGTARLLAFAGRYGPEPSKVYKEEGRAFAMLAFASPADRSSFVSGFRAGQQHPNAANSEMLLLLPGQAVPEEAVAAMNSNNKRKHGPEQPPRKAAAAGNDRQKRGDQQQRGGHKQQQQQQGPRDIRGVVCPWWDRPYHEQLADKMGAVTGALRQMAEEVGRTYPLNNPKPEWLLAALSSPDSTAVQLQGIYRSPQVDGYRNKAEFSIGLDDQERPTVGFLQGNYVDGHTQVVDPSGCVHMSPTSLAYAAATTAFLRSPDNKLPAWDKRKGQGFWRLLVVREGRDQTFLPLPAVNAYGAQPAATAADGSSDQQQQQRRKQRLGKLPPMPVLPPTPLADLPVAKWLVQNPAAAAAADGKPLSEVFEGEAPAPSPSRVMVMVQINPLAAPEGPPQIKQQLSALEAALKAAAAAQGLALTSLAVQYHSGVSNAAPATAPFTPFGMLPPVNVPAAADGPVAAADGPAAAGGPTAEGGVLGISDALCELQFRVSPTAFYQVNAGGTCLLYHTVGKMAGVGPNSLLLDVCCGTGTIGLTLAKQAAAVVGIDNVKSAIDDAGANAALNGISNAVFVCGAAEKLLGAVLQKHTPKYQQVVAVVDPPRVGLHKDVLFALLTCPAIKRLVYVSCNQDSLVLNTRLLCGAYRPDLNAPKVDPRRGPKRPRQEQKPYTPLPKYNPFRPTQAVAFDLFPHTAHTEVVVLFERD